VQGFDIVIMISRYWFVVLVWLILILLVVGSLKEYRIQREVRRATASQALGVLTVVSGEEELIGRRYGLRADNLIGRARRCDIRIPSNTVSRIHAQLYQRGDAFFLADSRSRTGTFLNDERIARPVEVEDGDVIAMGVVSLRVELNQR
jgi:hypothetical protein